MSEPQTFKTLTEEEYNKCLDAMAKLILIKEYVKDIAELLDMNIEEDE